MTNTNQNTIQKDDHTKKTKKKLHKVNTYQLLLREWWCVIVKRCAVRSLSLLRHINFHGIFVVLLIFFFWWLFLFEQHVSGIGYEMRNRERKRGLRDLVQ